MNIYHPEDSLDNLSNLQVNRQKQLLAQVKQQFATGLQKLQSPETREVGIGELKKIIEQYREQQYLRGYLALLKALKPNSNTGTKQHEILVISLLAQTYKQQLLDSLDKPPSLLKTTFRVVEILHTYFNDHSPTVQQACARALLDLNTHCLAQQSLDTKFSIIYAPLISILKSGVDKGSQATASACLAELIHYNRRVNDQELLNKLSPQMLGVILRVNSEYHELFHAISGMLQSQGLSFFQGRLVAFLSKIIPVVDGSREVSSANTTNLNTYMCKVNVCKILEKVGKLLPITEKEKLFELRIAESLQQAARHRIIQVQLAAARAFKAWKGEPTDQSPPKSRGLVSLEEKRNSKKLERSKSKQERDKIQSQLTFMKEDLQKLVKGGWGAANRAKNYVKKGSGVGGGYHGHSQLSPNSKSPGKSHKQHFQELRQFIKKSSKQNKHIDRFAQVRSQGAIRSKSPPAKEKSLFARSKSPGSNKKSAGNKRQQKKSSKGGQQAQIGFKQDEGDQMVHLPYQKSQGSKSVGSKKDNWVKGSDHVKMSLYQDYGISQGQARDLIEHEQSLMDHGDRMKINYTQMSQDQKKRGPLATPQGRGPSLQQKEFNIPLNQKLQTKTKQQIRKSAQQFKGISEEQLGELVQQFNLSQVSENLNEILNESDIQAFKAADPALIASHLNTPDVQKLRQMVAEKKQRSSAVSKFTKNDAAEPIEQQNKALPKSMVEQVGQSLDFTVSNQSKAKSPARRQEIQFTLNPKDRFSNLKQSPLPEKQKQIQEQIAMSQYEQSFPRDQPLPMILPKVAPITQIPLRHSLLQPKYDQIHPQPQEKLEYQKLIKNPPKKEEPKGVSGLKGSRATAKSQVAKLGPAEEQPQDEDLKQKWLQIVRQAEQSQTNNAYELALQLDDPVYLLRLMLISKLQMKKLSPETVRRLWKKFMEMYSQRFIDVMTVGLLSEGNQLDLLSKCLSVEEVQQAMVGLYELSGNTRGKMSYRAATLYNEIEHKMQGG